MSSDAVDRPSEEQSAGSGEVDDRNDRDEHDDPDVLRAQVRRLDEENRRLRTEYVRARRSQHRRAALGLGLVGAVAIAAAALFPDERTVLLALGGTGTFAAVLTYFLAPGQFVPASVGDRIYGSLAANQSRIATALGLRDDRVYVPFDADGRATARLFVPQREAFEVPRGDDLRGPFVVSENDRTRGLSLSPTGDPLLDELRTTVAGDPATEPGRLGEQVADAVVETFELADSVSVDVEDGRLTAAVGGSAYGDLDRFDHPIASLFATALAAQLSTPVELSTRRSDDDRSEFLLTCRWGDGRETAE